MIFEVIGKCGNRITLEEQFQGMIPAKSAFIKVHTLMADNETDYIEVTATDEETLEVKSITKYWLEGGKWKSEFATVEDSDL